jgi:RNA polymerase sigma factor (sigma-70 family)
VAATRAGDDRAFECLYERYQRRIAAYVQGMVKDHGRAEDITQEVFISALRRMRETDRPIIFKPWVYEIAKNACIDAFRRSRRAEEISYDADGGLGPSDHGRLVSSSPAPDAAVDTRMTLDTLRGAFGGLSETHHDILVMRELEGLSYREIGQRLGMSRPSVESTLFRARRRLTEEYEELASGERCTRIQSLIADTDGRRMGVRDERRMARHVSHCQPCRRAAYAAGIDIDRRSLREKIAALLPLPAVVKRRWFGGGGDDGGAVARWSSAAGQYAEPMSGWVKAAAVAAVAATGVGAGVGVTEGTSKPAAREQAPVAAPVSTGASSSSTSSAPAAPARGTTSPNAPSRTVGAKGRTTRSTGAPAGSADRPGTSKTGADGAARPGSGSGSGGRAGGASKAGADPASAPSGRSVRDGAAGAVDRTTGTVNNTVSGTAGKAKETVDKTVSGATKTVTDTTKGVTGAVDKTVRETTGAVDKATNGATAPVTGAVNNVTTTATNQVNTTVGAAAGTVTGAVNNPVGTVTGAVNNPVGTVTGAVGVSVPSVPNVPRPAGGSVLPGG